MDLIEMPEYNGFNLILRVVDHLSKFGYACPIKTKTSEEVGKSLTCILATSIMPRILQSDNGGEVSYCSSFNMIEIMVYFLWRKWLFFNVFFCLFTKHFLCSDYYIVFMITF
jgi:hypothetical protein